jgi:hypothetical protein
MVNGVSVNCGGSFMEKIKKTWAKPKIRVYRIKWTDTESFIMDDKHLIKIDPETCADYCKATTCTQLKPGG